MKAFLIHVSISAVSLAVMLGSLEGMFYLAIGKL
jgi:hypothetical protein